jgi:hypothetical protein
MEGWIPSVNGFCGVEDERNDRKYILWQGTENGKTVTKRLRLDELTENELVQELQDK